MSTVWTSVSISLTAVHSYVPALCLEMDGISRYSSSDARSPVKDHTHSGRKGRRSFRVNVTSQQLWPGLILSHPESPHGFWERHHHTSACMEMRWRKEGRKVLIKSIPCNYISSHFIFFHLNFSLCLNCAWCTRVKKYSGIWSNMKMYFGINQTKGEVQLQLSDRNQRWELSSNISDRSYKVV